MTLCSFVNSLRCSVSSRDALWRCTALVLGIPGARRSLVPGRSGAQVLWRLWQSAVGARRSTTLSVLVRSGAQAPGQVLSSVALVLRYSKVPPLHRSSLRPLLCLGARLSRSVMHAPALALDALCRSSTASSALGRLAARSIRRLVARTLCWSTAY